MSTIPAPAPKFTLPGYTIVQARFPRSNADVVVNTFVFKRETGNDTNIKNRLDTFYFGTATGQTLSISRYLSGFMQTPSYYMRDADQEVGTPGRELPGTGFLPASTDLLPPDLAICASYRAALPNSKRRRGRIYLGPLQATVEGGGGAKLYNGTGRITDSVRANIAAACKGLAGLSPSNDVTWVIASRVGNVAAPIVRGYVDTAFDTMRSRDPQSQFFGRTDDTWAVSI